MSRRVILVLTIAISASRPLSAAPIDFAHEIAPLLAKHCVECHANGRYEGDVSFDTRESLLTAEAAEPGASADSAIIERVLSDDPDFRMPPEGDKLSAQEVALLRRWIDEELPWEPGFTFKKSAYEAPLEPRRPELPPAEPGIDNPIDRIVMAYWRDRGVTAPPQASDAVFCRRVHLDLVGLPPTTEALAAFLADEDPQKRTKLVERLLDDRVAYADHWMSFWNDLLRNDYAGAGFIDGGREQITAWLYEALLDNKPYDQFVRELVAPQPKSAGFAKGIIWRGQVNASQIPALQFSQNVGQAFLGINLKCASCHDSFVDNWKLTDSYGLAAIISEQPIELHRCDKPTGVIAEARFLFPTLGAIDAQAPRDERLKQLAALMTDPRNGRLTRTMVNRLWHRLLGRGIVHPVDSMGTAPWSEDLLDYLAIHLADSGYDLKKSLALIATSNVYGLQSVAWDEGAPADEYVFAGPAPKRMTAEQFVDAITEMTGVDVKKTADDAIFVKPLAKHDGAGRQFVRASLVESTPLMRTLGRPNREQVVTARPTELTTLEALDLSNGESLAEMLLAGASRLRKDYKDIAASDLCQRLFVAATSRAPTDLELSRLVELAGAPPTTDGLADALWCIVMLPEFQIVR